jgi:hypothetical protein
MPTIIPLSVNKVLLCAVVTLTIKAFFMRSLLSVAFDDDQAVLQAKMDLIEKVADKMMLGAN